MNDIYFCDYPPKHVLIYYYAKRQTKKKDGGRNEERNGVKKVVNFNRQ